MEDILKTAQPGEETRKIKVGLARMLVTDGNSVGGRALVEQVLAEDAGDVEALKLKATWLILSDEVGEAITILRRALDQNPREADIMTLMAQAYERDGNRDLMREMLSLAVEASGRAPEESLRYAQFLVSEDKILPAEGVLIDALRMAPSMTELLAPLGQIYVEMKDWPRAEAVAGELEQVGDKEAANQAAALRAAIFGGQQKTDQAIGYLQSLIAEGQGGLAPKIAIIRAHLANGQNQKALAYSAELLASRPDDPSLRFIDASVRSVTGDTVAAEATFRSLVDEDPTRLQVWMALFRVVAADQDRAAEAEALLDKALITLPDQAELQWAKAGMLERRGDFEGAIAIYEGMYTVNSSNQIVANNLASMLSNHRTDQASLDRAEVIARRLRGSGIASYQDTYGWIAYLRGNYEEARGELEKAAAGLPDDPGVQYHLAMTYLKLGEKEKAAEYFGKSVGLLPAESTLPFATPARDELAKLVAEGISTSN
jgi:Flp pilus assembly protein TadD